MFELINCTIADYESEQDVLLEEVLRDVVGEDDDDVIQTYVKEHSPDQGGW